MVWSLRVFVSPSYASQFDSPECWRSMFSTTVSRCSDALFKVSTDVSQAKCQLLCWKIVQKKQQRCISKSAPIVGTERSVWQTRHNDSAIARLK